MGIAILPPDINESLENFTLVKNEEGVKIRFGFSAVKNLSGNAISSIGLVVAAVTLFIVIFINAITRRRYIGILKGIGIDERSIEISYVLQSIFYATVGSILLDFSHQKFQYFPALLSKQSI